MRNRGGKGRGKDLASKVKKSWQAYSEAKDEKS
jgi:hypothetical protein